MTAPFSGLKVTEIGNRISSAFCGRLCADLGAQVVKIEPTSAVSFDSHAPSPTNSTDRESALFTFLNYAKQSVAVERLDVRSGLFAGADIVISSLSPKALENYGLNYDALAAQNPRVVIAKITPFGLTGPYRDFQADELVVTALSGMMRRIGSPGRPPLTLPLEQAGYQAGLAATAGIASALLAQRLSDSGQEIEIAEAEVLATVHIGYCVTRYQLAGNNEKREGHRFGNQPYPQTVLPCKDGYVELNTPEGQQWKRLLDMLGNPEWSRDPKYKNRFKNNNEYADELDALITPWLLQQTRAEIFRLAAEYDLPCAPVRTIDELLSNEHLAERDFFSGRATLADGRTAVVPRTTAKFSAIQTVRSGAVPGLGQHTSDIAENPQAPARAPIFKLADKPGYGPLAGYRVLDLGWVWAGAIPGQLLADMGAEVIKLESTQRIDYMRLGRPLIGNVPDPEQNPWFHAVNRNKKSITVNLKSPRGRELVKDLAAKSDIVIENFAPGFLEKSGLDYQALRQINPKLIMLSMSGMGQTGRDSKIPAYAPLLAGMSGLDSLVGYPGERVLGVQQPYADSNAGLTGAFSVLAALVHRERTGEGQHIDAAEQEATIAVLGEAVTAYSLDKIVPTPMGNDRQGYAPRGTYPCSGDDNWIAISVVTDEQWRALCSALGDESLANDPRFNTYSGRWDNRRALDAALAIRTSAFEATALMDMIQAAGVAAAPVNGPQGLMNDRHFKARGTFVQMKHPVLGDELIYATAWRLSKTPGAVVRHAPILGEHNRDVFEGLLGLSAAEVDQLVAEGVLT